MVQAVETPDTFPGEYAQGKAEWDAENEYLKEEGAWTAEVAGRGNAIRYTSNGLPTLKLLPVGEEPRYLLKERLKGIA